MQSTRVVALIGLLAGLVLMLVLLLVGGTYDYRDDTSDRYACNAVISQVRNGSDYPEYYEEIGESPEVDQEDDLRRDGRAELAADCDRHRQNKMGLALLVALPTAAAGYIALRPTGER